jgi:hypothetical protein
MGIGDSAESGKQRRLVAAQLGVSTLQTALAAAGRIQAAIRGFSRHFGATRIELRRCSTVLSQPSIRSTARRTVPAFRRDGIQRRRVMPAGATIVPDC